MKNLSNFYKAIQKNQNKAFRNAAYIKEGFLIGTNGAVMFKVHLSLFDCQGIDLAENKGLDQDTLKALANSKIQNIEFNSEGVKILNGGGITFFKYAGELKNNIFEIEQGLCPLPENFFNFFDKGDSREIKNFTLPAQNLNTLVECFPKELRTSLHFSFVESVHMKDNNFCFVETNNPLCFGVIYCVCEEK